MGGTENMSMKWIITLSFGDFSILLSYVLVTMEMTFPTFHTCAHTHTHTHAHSDPTPEECSQEEIQEDENQKG